MRRVSDLLKGFYAVGSRISPLLKYQEHTYTRHNSHSFPFVFLLSTHVNHAHLPSTNIVRKIIVLILISRIIISRWLRNIRPVICHQLHGLRQHPLAATIRVCLRLPSRMRNVNNAVPCWPAKAMRYFVHRVVHPLHTEQYAWVRDKRSLKLPPPIMPTIGVLELPAPIVRPIPQRYGDVTMREIQCAMLVVYTLSCTI